MRVSRLINGDWQFGRGRAGYVKDSEAVRQNISVVLRTMRDSWFLDMNRGGDWRRVFGGAGGARALERETERLLRTVQGIKTINRIAITRTDDRRAIATIDYTDIFNVTATEEIQL